MSPEARVVLDLPRHALLVLRRVGLGGERGSELARGQLPFPAQPVEPVDGDRGEIRVVKLLEQVIAGEAAEVVRDEKAGVFEGGVRRGEDVQVLLPGLCGIRSLRRVTVLVTARYLNLTLELLRFSFQVTATRFCAEART